MIMKFTLHLLKLLSFFGLMCYCSMRLFLCQGLIILLAPVGDVVKIILICYIQMQFNDVYLWAFAMKLASVECRRTRFSLLNKICKWYRRYFFCQFLNAHQNDWHEISLCWTFRFYIWQNWHATRHQSLTQSNVIANVMVLDSLWADKTRLLIWYVMDGNCICPFGVKNNVITLRNEWLNFRKQHFLRYFIQRKKLYFD